jgi:hypothetical protein
MAKSDTEHLKLGNGKTVTVACKLPNGLRLQLFAPVTERIATQNGFADIVVSRPSGPEFVLNGWNTEPFKAFSDMKVKQAMPALEGAYALTHGIPAEFMGKWLTQYRDSPLVTNRIILVMPDKTEANAAARDHDSIKSGMEPIDGDSPMKIMGNSLQKIERAKVD